MEVGVFAGQPGRPTGLFASMFTDRKALFVDLLGWDVPVVDDMFEIDAFDGEKAIYILAIGEDGAHAGSLRLLPTSRPHILGSLFAPLAECGVPTGPNILEITRLCLPSRHDAARRLVIRNWLITAMVDHALAHGVDTLTGVVTAAFREKVLGMGWRARPLGPAQVINGARLGAFALSIDPATPGRLAANGIYQRRPANAAAEMAICHPQQGA